MKKTFSVEGGVAFDPSELDFCCPQKEAVAKAIVKKMKEIADLSNANIVHSANRFLSKRIWWMTKILCGFLVEKKSYQAKDLK